jgi:uncharacterized membrane protein
MEDHPILGAVLYVIGTVLVGLAYLGSALAAPHVSSIIIGHVFAFIGFLLFFLGCRKLNRAPEKTEM